MKLHLPGALTDADCFESDPITYFEFEGVLDPELFERLGASYPTSAGAQYEVHGVGTKKYLDNSHPEFWSFMAEEPEWRELYEAFSSQPVLDRLYRLTLPYLSHRPESEQLPWTSAQPALRGGGAAATWTRRARSLARSRGARWVRGGTQRARRAGAHLRGHTPVYLGFEFSELLAGDRIPPHTDVPSKLLSLMIYFPEGDEAQLPLGTEFYRARPGFETSTMWASGMPDDAETDAFFEQHDCYYQLPYRGNRLVGFVKTNRSWHGLRDICLPPGRTRRALVVNIFRR